MMHHSSQSSVSLAQSASVNQGSAHDTDNSPDWRLQEYWRMRLARQARKGVAEQDLEHWIWILSAEPGDVMAERFLAMSTPKPLFVLQTMLRREATFRDLKCFGLLIDHIATHYIEKPFSSPEATKETEATQIVRKWHQVLSDDRNFSKVFNLLVFHSARDMPAMLEPLSQLVIHYLESMTAASTSGSGRDTSSFAGQCRVFNDAIQAYAQWSSLAPIAHSKWRWEAQKALLAYSTQLVHPFLLNKRSYQAIQQVMLALEKSRPERSVAERWSKTWPPFHRELDGTDEKRRIEDIVSRSALVGRLMQEVGYVPDEHDRAMLVLGGGGAGSHPTIQTRSFSPKKWHGKLHMLNCFSTWAAQVRATRNAQEAWQIFQTPPLPGLRPNFQVYGEMFGKLYAKVADGSSALQAGDSKAVFPTHNVNLTSYELHRLQPPKAESLYEQMIREGTRPVGKCLALLISNAASTEDALRYLQDSPWQAHATGLMVSDEPSLEALRAVPLFVLNAYVTLLCRLCPTFDGNRTHAEIAPYLLRAHQLVSRRLGKSSPDLRSYKSPWHALLRGFARPRAHVLETRSARKNDHRAVNAFLTAYYEAKLLTGLDAYMFEMLCIATQKAAHMLPIGIPARSDTTSAGHSQAKQGHIRGPAGRPSTIQSTLVSDFSTLSRQFVTLAETGTAQPQVQGESSQELTPGAMLEYMRALALLRLPGEMARAMEWLLDMREKGVLFREAEMSALDQRDLDELFDLFSKYASPRLPPEQSSLLHDKMDRRQK
jgi:DNA (cytosine-5)-methyltransferase 1